MDGRGHPDRRRGRRRRPRRPRPRRRGDAFAARGDLRIVGITGSNGKTTTKNLLARILEDEGETVAPRASFNNEVGAPLTMLRVTDGTRFLVSEFGASAPGEIARLAGLVEPDIGVVLMVGMAHAGGFGGIEATLEAKSELVRAASSGRCRACSTPTTRASRRWRRSRPSAGAAVRWFGRGGARRCARRRRRGHGIRHDASLVTADGASRAAASARARRAPRHERPRRDRRGHARSACRSQTASPRLETVELAERWRMQPLGLGPRTDHQRRLQRQPRLDVRGPAHARADHRSRRAHRRRARRDERARRVRRRGARPRRPARRAARHPAHRRRRARRAADVPRGDRRRARGTARPSSSPPPTRRTTT